MIMLSRNGSLKLDIHNDQATGYASATVDLPAGFAAQQGDLYDRVFAFAFDVLGLQSVELRARPSRERLKAFAAPTPLAYHERRI